MTETFNMVRTSVFTAAVVLAASTTFGASPSRSGKTVTWTGWFSDKGCATAKVKNGDIGPNGTACVKKCLKEGATPVFISEQARAMYDVKDHPTVIDDVGYHLEVTALLDEDAKTISVQSVKRLSEVVNTCALPRKKLSAAGSRY